ncbi:DUF1488 family protein [Paraburkholderia caribensis]|uniref:DUF1488 family protein n=1 Tax=Paraburkholderia caribensis TaxID=75105 RepID=UPI001D07EAAA|nr:DUF1488 family protein [Paraburkholderia caribensis]
MSEAKLNEPFYDFDRDNVMTDIVVEGRAILSVVTREALEDHFGAKGSDDADALIKIYLANRDAIDAVLVAHHEKHPDQQPSAFSGDFD